MLPLKLDLRPQHLEIVKQILQKHVPYYAVWAFGSRIKDKAKPYSDLDLAVICDQALPWSVQASLAEDFSESDLPFRVDVVDWAVASESFRQIIQQAYLVVLDGQCPKN